MSSLKHKQPTIIRIMVNNDTIEHQQHKYSIFYYFWSAHEIVCLICHPPRTTRNTLATIHNARMVVILWWRSMCKQSYGSYYAIKHQFIKHHIFGDHIM